MLTTRFVSRISALACLGAVACTTFTVSARAGDLLTPVFGTGDLNLTVGGIGVVLPRYEGSKHYHIVGFPYVIPAGLDDGKSRIAVRGLDDLRLRVLEFQGFEVGPLIGWRMGRQEDDAAHLAGLGDIHGGLIVGGYAGYRMGWLMPFVSYHHQVTGDSTGGILRFGAEGVQQVLPNVKLTGIFGASYADNDYMDSYFGVTTAQSATSRLAAFDADAGIKDVYFDLMADYKIDAHWSVKLGGRYSRLLGDAADSPVIETRDQFQAIFGLSYSFSAPQRF